MFIKIQNEKKIYPYSLDMLKEEYQYISFPDMITNDILSEYNVYPVIQTDKPSATVTQKVIEILPSYIDEKWYQSWEIISMTDDEITQDKNQRAINIRSIRDHYLIDTDWIVLKSIEKGISIPDEWILYRQELRDVTMQAGFPYYIVWPTRPINSI